MKLAVDRMKNVEMVINVFRDRVLMLARLIDAALMLNVYRNNIVACVLVRQVIQAIPTLNALQVSSQRIFEKNKSSKLKKKISKMRFFPPYFLLHF